MTTLLLRALVGFLMCIQSSFSYICTQNISDFSYTQHCPGCLPPKNVQLHLDVLTVGNEKNEIKIDDFGKVCIKGKAKIPLGFIKDSETLDLRARIEIDFGIMRIPLPCGIIYSELEKFINGDTGGEDTDYDYDYDYDYDDKDYDDRSRRKRAVKTNVDKNTKIGKADDQKISSTVDSLFETTGTPYVTGGSTSDSWSGNTGTGSPFVTEGSTSDSWSGTTGKPEANDAGQQTTIPTVDSIDESSLISSVLDRFDYETCTLKDICGLLGPGESIRQLLDDVVDKTEDLDIFKGYPKRNKNACSADFLGGKVQKLDSCYQLGVPPGLQLDGYKDYAMGQESMKIQVTLELLKRDTAVEGDKGQHILCLFMPLKVKFE